MASINKLAIRGVRSFSPEDSEQVVEFFFPITIIVGANGCGKTTIIESLKYALTGGLPPGSNAGRSFVHDPRGIGQQLVKASVKLRFTTKAGQPMVLIRSMELTQKRATVSFRQLDGALRSQDPRTGQRSSISHKCTELDRQVPNLMGVSKAILDYVLFCHQEDSSWPLQDSAILKKRFDEIFDSTRYSKAIEVMRKKEKAYISLAKDLKADLAGLKSHRHAAQGFRNEFEGLNENLEELDESKKELKGQIEDVEKEIAEFTKIYENYEAKQREIDSLNNQLEQARSKIATQRSFLEDDMTESHTLESLQTLVDEFDSKVSGQRQQLDGKRGQIRSVEQKIAQLENESKKLNNDLARIEVKRNKYQAQMRERQSMMESMAQTYALELDLGLAQDQSFVANASMVSHKAAPQFSQDSAASITEEVISDFLGATHKRETELSDELTQHKKRMKAEDAEFYETTSDLKGRVEVIKSELSKIDKKRKEYTEEQNAIAKKTRTTSLRKTEVEDARRKADAIAKQLEEANKEAKQSEVPAKIRHLQDKSERLKRDIDEDNQTLQALRVNSDEQQKIVVLKEQAAVAFETLVESVEEGTSALQNFNIPAPKIQDCNEDSGDQNLQELLEGLNETVSKKYDEANGHLLGATEDTNRTHRAISEKSALLSSNQASVSALKSKLDVLQGSVAEMRNVFLEIRRHETSLGLKVQGSDSEPRELLAYLNDRLSALAENTPVGDAQTVKRIMKKLKRMAKVMDDSEKGFHIACPCCKAVLTEVAQVRRLQETLDELGSPKTSPFINSDEGDVDLKPKYEAWKQQVGRLTDDVRDFNRMKEDHEALQQSTQGLMDDLANFRAILKNQEGEKKDLQTTHDDLRSLHDQTKRWCEDAGKIAEHRMTIVHKETDLTQSMYESTRTLDEVELDVAKKHEERDEISSKVANLMRDQQRLNGNISRLTEMVQKLEKMAREKESKYADEKKSLERKAELNDLIRDLKTEERKYQDQFAPLKTKISSKESEHSKSRMIGERKEQKLADDLACFKTDVAELRKVHDSIVEFENSKDQEQEERVLGQSGQIAESIDAKRNEIRDLQAALTKEEIAFGDQERRKAQLQSNITIIQSTQEAKELEASIKKLEDQKESMENGDKIRKRQRRAQQRKEELQEEKHRSEGRWSEIVEQIRSLKRKLSAPEYKNVEEEYRQANIKYKTTQLAAEDLKKYYTAIDKALLMFHGLKIAEINKIIRDLWMMTYKGEDITNIEIVSGQDSGLRAGKSYNYRVVMTKGNAEMDMRGRCSAGQRVLASIVIRLALAETFGINIGTLALDEPTVNLDYKNKKGLAVALAQIVSSRSQQSNFQLVLITHDEEFVLMMKTELASLTGFSMPEKYFQVSREEGIDGKYYSKINAVNWDELV